MLADTKNIGGSLEFGQSVKGLKWKLVEPDNRLITAFFQKLGISNVLATLLINRGVKTVEDAAMFLNPKIRESMPNPFQLMDMEKAAIRIADAVINNEKIAVFGDYDVDGATSTALLKKFFTALGADIEVYIPNRILEGYGPNIAALKKLKDSGHNLILTVDCGIVSHEPLKEAKEYGIEIIIFDHHLSSDVLPEAFAIINPNRFDEIFPLKSIAAVGVAFLAAVAIRAKLREKGFFADKEDLDLMQYLDLVALGTVCDVMQLTGINRAFVSQGLKMIAGRKNVGLAVLADVSNLAAKPQSFHLGFVLGPRINAGGRVGEGILGSILLSTDDEKEAFEIAHKLERLNNERRAIEATLLEEAIAYVESRQLHLKPLIMVKGHDWHQGVLGILASRIKEKYSKPSAIVSIVDGMGKGSARSITGIDLGTMIARAKAEGIIMQGGGHAMAGGFTVKEEDIDGFYAYMLNKLENTEHIFEQAKDYYVDAALSVSGVTGELVRVINRASPFGPGNPQPKFALCDIHIMNVRMVGNAHLMVIVSDSKSDKKVTLKCMLFKSIGTEIARVISSSIGKNITLFGTLQENFNSTEKADFIIEDVVV